MKSIRGKKRKRTAKVVALAEGADALLLPPARLALGDLGRAALDDVKVFADLALDDDGLALLVEAIERIFLKILKYSISQLLTSGIGRPKMTRLTRYVPQSAGDAQPDPRMLKRRSLVSYVNGTINRPFLPAGEGIQYGRSSWQESPE